MNCNRGIFNDDHGIYFNFDIPVPAACPKDLKILIDEMAEAVLNKDLGGYLSRLQPVFDDARHAYDDGCLSVDDMNAIHHKIGQGIEIWDSKISK